MALRMVDIPNEYEFKQLYPQDREWINTGNSAIIAPNGQFLAGPLETEEGILYADIDLQQIIAAKRMFDAVGHYARPDVFEFTVKPKSITTNK
jgi:nitrilase